jgi:hypothetical protein
MAQYQVTIEIITRLQREVEASSAEEAEDAGEIMFREYKAGRKTYIIGTEQHQSIELSGSPRPRGRFAPVGQ